MNKPHTYKVCGICIIDKLNFNLYNIFHYKKGGLFMSIDAAGANLSNFAFNHCKKYVTIFKPLCQQLF